MKHPTRMGVPNPYRTILHNWKGGPYNEGSLFHGPNYTEPMFGFPWKRTQSLQGTETANMDMGRIARTRNGSFSNKGYGGGIFNGNSALGTNDPDMLNLGALVVWGQPHPLLASTQVKMNALLAAKGRQLIRTDGVLDESFCRAITDIQTDYNSDILSANSTKEENEARVTAVAQCLAKGLTPQNFPKSPGGNVPPGGGTSPGIPQQPGTQPGLPWTLPTLPNFQLPQLTQPQVTPGLPQFPGGDLPMKTCPPGQVFVDGACKPVDLDLTACLPGTIRGPDGKCKPVTGDKDKPGAGTQPAKATAASSNSTWIVAGIGVAVLVGGVVWLRTRRGGR
jgi:hypothetical protein